VQSLAAAWLTSNQKKDILGMVEVVHFTLYTRSYCHLCDDMLEALQALSSEYPFTVELMDVDADETLVAQFDELVPVLFGKKGTADSVQLCNYFLDDAKVRAFLKSP